ncbi:MAK10-like protein [Tanacetum coccineum]
MRDENHIRTLGDSSKPSHEGYRNTIDLRVGNNVVTLRSDTIWKEWRLRYFQFSFRDQASNWLERLPAGSITTWEDLTTRFLPPLLNSSTIQRLMEAHLAPTQPTQVNKITTSCKICGGSHDTQYYLFRNPFSSTTMGDENPIRTLGDYSKPSHDGYRNTIDLRVGNNVVPLRSDTIRLVQNGCSFHGLRSEDPNQHLKDFLKLMDSLDLDGENKERARLHLFQFSLRDQASN